METSLYQNFKRASKHPVKLHLFETTVQFQKCTQLHAVRNVLFQRTIFLLKGGNMCLWSHLSRQNSTSAFKTFLSLRKNSSCFRLPSWWMQKGKQLRLAVWKLAEEKLLSLPDFYHSLENAKCPLMRHQTNRKMSLFGWKYTWANISSVNYDKKQNEKQTADAFLWHPPHPNPQNYSRPDSYPSGQSSALLVT